MRDYSVFTTEELLARRKTTCEIERLALQMRRQNAISFFKYSQDRIYAHNCRVKIDEVLLWRINDSPFMDEIISLLELNNLTFPQNS